jgi:peptide/nickel transport system substrate-binding protein
MKPSYFIRYSDSSSDRKKIEEYLLCKEAKLKKLIVPLAILLICAFVITGCSGSTTTPATPVATPTVAPAITTTKPTTAIPTTAATTTAPASATQAASNKYGGILRYANTSSPGTPIGWIPETFGGSTITIQLVMQFPLKEMSDATLVPWLADSWTEDPTTNSITMKLKKGITFGDGTVYDAKAVKWNFDMIKASPMQAGFAKYWKSIDVIDDYTLKFTYTEWQNRFLRDFADVDAMSCSPTAYQKNGVDWMRWNMTGTGAFVQTNFQRDVITQVRKNNTYWENGLPYLDGIDLMYVVDEMTREALFKSGGCELMDLAGNARMASELQAAGYQIIPKNGGATVLWPDSLNKDSPWANAKVRQAAEYAIDKASIAKAFGYGFMTPIYQLPTQTSLAYNPNFTGERKYDAAKAKALLTEAGYPNGFKTSIIASTAGNRDIPLAIKANLDAVGIQTDVQFQDPSKYNTTMMSTWNNALLFNSTLEWPNFNNSLNFYFGLQSAFFPITGRPPGWVDTFNASMRSPKPDKALMQKCVQALYDDATVIPLYTLPSMTAATQNVHDTNMTARSSIYWDMEKTWLSK